MIVRLLMLSVLTATTPLIVAAEDAAVDSDCVLEKMATLDGDTTIAEVKALCRIPEKSRPVDSSVQDDSIITRRIMENRAESNNSNVLNGYRRNYFMPVTYIRNPNAQPLVENGSFESLDDVEAKFQLSFQVRLADDLWLPNDSLSLGFTTEAFWQSYNRDESYPFREISYEPEIFYGFPTDKWPFKVDKGYVRLGLVHQSNGRDRPLSRSWNRVYADFIWEQGQWLHSFKPWWRIPQNERVPGEPGGDDNPDIEKFLGHFEYRVLYHWGDHEFSGMFRHNLRSDAKGAAQLEWVFPLWSNRIRGIMQYHVGYGETLLDYNVSTERLGVGILLTDLL